MLGSSWCCSGSPLQPHAVVHEFIEWTASDCPRQCWPRPGQLCHAHLAVPCTSGCITSSRAICRQQSIWLQTEHCCSTGPLLWKPYCQYKSSKATQGSRFGVFLLVCQQAGMCRREAAHFQGLCEQEGQLLEFKVTSSTVNLFLCCLWLGRAGEHLSYLIFCYSMFGSASSVP